MDSEHCVRAAADLLYEYSIGAVSLGWEESALWEYFICFDWSVYVCAELSSRN